MTQGLLRWPAKLIFIGLPLICLLGGCGTNEVLTKANFKMTAPVDSTALRSDVRNEAYVIRRGDEVAVIVQGYPEMDTTATVGESGTIPTKLVGEQRAEGLSRKELANELHTKLSGYIRTQFVVTVTVLNKLVRDVTVLGEVTRQGVYPVPSGTSLLQVIATAGGSTSDSDLRHVKIFPAGDMEHPVEVDISQTAMGIVRGVPEVKPGDLVFVPKEENVIRELSGFFRDAIFLFSFFTVFK